MIMMSQVKKIITLQYECDKTFFDECEFAA